MVHTALLTRKESRQTRSPYHSKRSNWKGMNMIALYLHRIKSPQSLEWDAHMASCLVPYIA